MATVTTITPYWNREVEFRLWIKALGGIKHPEVDHLVIFVGERPSEELVRLLADAGIFWEVEDIQPSEKSIGHFHNLGAARASTEWMMKLDLDCFPHEGYWPALLQVIGEAKPREWFNGGMLYLNEQWASKLICEDFLPLGLGAYVKIMENRIQYSGYANSLPAASNFICRREEYLALGGCDSRFKGAMWEDYQQLYMLERHWLGKCPFGDQRVTLHNVTGLCRDILSRKKAVELWQRNSNLCLFHRWHPANRQPFHLRAKDANKRVLFEHVTASHKQTPLHRQRVALHANRPSFRHRKRTP